MLGPWPTRGTIYQAVPLEAALQQAPSLNRIGFGRAIGPGFGIDIYPLQFVSAPELQKLIETIFPKGTVLQANATHRYLVIAGTSQDRFGIQQLIEQSGVDILPARGPTERFSC